MKKLEKKRLKNKLGFTVLSDKEGNKIKGGNNSEMHTSKSWGATLNIKF